MVSVLIIEDNPLTSRDLSEILEENHFLVSGICYSAEDALNRIPVLNPDVLLVDVQLKGQMTGIELVRSLEKEKPVVYLTANSDHETVSRVIETQPASYLTKPFDEKELVVAIELAARRFNSSLPDGIKPFPFIFLKSGKVFEKVKAEDILYVEADGSYCKVFTNEKEYVLTGNLTSISSGFDQECFLRIHRSYLINVTQVDSLDHDYVQIARKDLPIGITYKDEVKTKLRRFT